MEKEQINILKKAKEQLGKNFQVMLALEEMAELSKELLKNINRNESNFKEINQQPRPEGRGMLFSRGNCTQGFNTF